MPNQRIQADPLLPGAPPDRDILRLTPRSSPVDTFHRPDEQPLNEGPNGLQQLAQALGQVAPTVFKTADIQHAQETSQQLSAGEQAVLADKRLQNRAALRQAVASGQLPAAKNPWFLQGMRQQVYRIEGQRYDQGLREAYANSDSRNEDDISDFVGGFTSKWMDNLGADPGDPEVSKILTPAMERSQASLLASHRSERDQAIQATVEQNTGTEIGLTLDNMDESGGSPDFYAKTIHGIIQDQYQNGLDGTRSNQIAASAIARKATEKLDTGFLDLLDKIPSGPGGQGNLGQIGFVKDLRRETEKHIYQAIEERDRIAAKNSKDAKDQAVQDGLSQGFKAITDKPNADIAPIMKKLADADPEAAEKLFSWRQAHINDANKGTVEDPNTVVGLTGKVFSGNGDLGEVLDANKKGLINLETASKLAENIDRSKEFRSIFRDPTIAEMHKSLGMVIKGSDTDFKSTDAINAQRAQNAFIEGMTNYKRDNPKASDLDVLRHGRELQKELVDAYAGGASQDATSAVEVNSKNAMVVDPTSVDWQHKPIYTSAEMRPLAVEYKAKGQDSQIGRLAARLGVPVKDLFTTQFALSQAPAKPKK